MGGCKAGDGQRCAKPADCAAGLTSIEYTCQDPVEVERRAAEDAAAAQQDRIAKTKARERDHRYAEAARQQALLAEKLAKIRRLEEQITAGRGPTRSSG